jgi:DNA polymerase III delta subunit
MKIQKPLDFVTRSTSRLPIVLLYGNDPTLQQFYLNCLRSSFAQLTYTIIDSSKQLAGVIAPSLFDGENSGKLIYLVNAGERDLAMLQTFAENAERSHLLVIASALPTKSKLVSYFLTHKSHAAVPCYDLKSHELKSFIAQIASKREISLTPDVLLFLAEAFATHPHVLFTELDKLFLYQADQKELLSLKTAQSLVCFNNPLKLDALSQGMLLGNMSLLLSSLSTSLIEDEFILIIRSLIKNYCQLFEILTHMQQSIPYAEALERLSTPVFFQMKPLLAQAAERWSLAQCATALERLLLLEKAYKNQEVQWPSVQAELLAIANKISSAAKAA